MLKYQRFKCLKNINNIILEKFSKTASCIGNLGTLLSIDTIVKYIINFQIILKQYKNYFYHNIKVIKALSFISLSNYKEKVT